MAELISARKSVARKVHGCTACGRAIEPGERYSVSFYVDGGDSWTWRECAHCTAWLGIYNLGELCDDGYTRDSLREAAREISFLQLGARSVRHAAQFLMGWRTQAGTLLPIPTALRGQNTEGESR